MKTKRFRFRNGKLKAPKTYYLRAMLYWAKDSFEAHKQLQKANREIKELKAKLIEALNNGQTNKR